MPYEQLLICLGILILLCLMAALPLSIIALVMAIRAARRVEDLARRLGAERTWPDAGAGVSIAGRCGSIRNMPEG